MKIKQRIKIAKIIARQSVTGLVWHKREDIQETLLCNIIYQKISIQNKRKVLNYRAANRSSVTHQQCRRRGKKTTYYVQQLKLNMEVVHKDIKVLCMAIATQAQNMTKKQETQRSMQQTQVNQNATMITIQAEHTNTSTQIVKLVEYLQDSRHHNHG